VSTSTTTGSGWLTANLNAATTPSTLTISASPFGLSTGTYTGSVTVNSSNGTGQLVIPVTLNVSTLALISTDKSELIFGGGSSSSSSQTLAISSSSTNFTFTATTNVINSPTTWLSVNNVTGTTPSNLTVTVNPANLPDGTYLGTVTIAAAGTGNTPLVIPVALTINSATALTVNPALLSFTQLQGGTLPNAQSVTVSSQTPVAFSSTTSINTPVGVNWLNVVPLSTTTNGLLQIGVNSAAAALPPGTYTAVVNVFSSGQTSTPINVTLTVVPAASLVLAPATLNFSGRVAGPTPAAQTVQVTSSSAATPVPFTVTSDSSWLTATPVSGTTPAQLSVTANPTGQSAGTLTGQLTLTPSGIIGGTPSVINVTFVIDATPAPNVAGFANAATFQAGSLSPGMIFTLVGTNLGPATAVSGQITGGRFTTTLSGVRVIMDGVAAPILYASATQINAVVPYSMAGRASARMTVEYNGIASNVIEPRLVDANPGVFTADGRQAAMLNADQTYNAPNNPAARGSIVAIYVTGEGQTNPAGVDGEVIAVTNLKKPLLPVRVRVGGVEVPATDISYAGSAPTLVSGLMQVNFKIPLTAPTGTGTSLEVFVGTAQSQPGVTLSVKQ
jgi:uncharacterized protein (TIGR03437 family)